MVNATLAKDPAARPDVFALAHHPFTRRHQASPVDLAAWLRQSPSVQVGPSSSEM
jgi:hypothetical protein